MMTGTGCRRRTTWSGYWRCYWHCHHQVHGWIFMVTRQWQLVVSMSSYHVCAYCGDWRREQLVRIRSECWRGETLTLHQHYQVPQIRIYDWLTANGVRRLPRQDNCHVGVQPTACTLWKSKKSVSTLLDFLKLNNSLVYKTQPVCLMQS